MANTLISYGTVVAWCGVKVVMNGHTSRLRRVHGSRPSKISCRVELQKLLNDCDGQDFIEYALMAGFAATMAAAVDPAVFNSVRTLWQPIISLMNVAGSQS